jgi:hypothetical protein
MPHEPGVEEILYIWELKKAGKGERVRVSVIESGYWRHSHQQLLKQLDQCMRPDMPFGKGKSAGIGDVQYVAQNQDDSQTTAVFFTRGNLRISVQSVGKHPVDVTSLAKRLDGRLVKPPGKGEEKRGAVSAMESVEINMASAETATLLEALPAATLSSGMTRIIVDEGELKREGDTLYCISAKAGAKRAEILNFKLDS